jgi:hypothetical protein
MIHDGHANNRAAWLVAKDITAWLDEEDMAAHEAAGLGDNDKPADTAAETQAEAGALKAERDASAALAVQPQPRNIRRVTARSSGSPGNGR